jgi:cytochrome oxidase Cu insertion factor (SCO1/SenC/PrrC family)
MERESRKISVDIERKWIRIIVNHGKDEEILKLSIDEARSLKEQLNTTIEDYLQRQNIRID